MTVNDSVLHSYLTIISTLEKGDSGAKDFLTRTILPRVKQARLFAFDVQSYVELYHEADVFTTEEIACQKWISPTSENPPSEEEILDNMTLIQEAGRHVPFPEHLPFDHCLFIFTGSGVGLTKLQASMHMGYMEPSKIPFEEVTLLGFLVSWDGLVYEFLGGWDDEKLVGVMAPTVRDHDTRHEIKDNKLVVGGWNNPYSLNPWIVTSLVNFVNSYKSIVMEEERSFSAKHRFQKMAKTFGLQMKVPPFYYTVELKQELHRARSTFPGIPGAHRIYSHRWDVRRHERIRVLRGKYPIDGKTKTAITKRGYKLFEEELDQNTWRLLKDRGVARGSNEWIAIKSTWVSPHVRGPEDAPYIPSMRKPT